MSVQFSFSNGAKPSTKQRQSTLNQPLATSVLNNPENGPISLPPTPMEISPEELVIRLKQDGNILAEAGHFVRALSKWDEALLLDPTSATLHELKAQILMEMEEYEMALSEAELAVEYEKNWSDAHFSLGRVHFNLGNLELAKSCMEIALKLTTEQSDAMGRPQNENASQIEVEAELDEVMKLMELRTQMEAAQASSQPLFPSDPDPSTSMDTS